MKIDIIYVLIALFLVSCGDPVEEIIWKTNNSVVALNVEGSVTNDSIHHRLLLKTTQDYFYNQPLPAVSNATVYVQSGSKIYTYSESADTAGLYLSDEAFSGIVGNDYTLNIDLVEPLNGETHFTATSTLRKNFEIQYSTAAELIYPGLDENDSTLIVIAFIANDPSPGVDYFFSRLYVSNSRVSDSLVTDSLNNLILFNDTHQEDADENVYYFAFMDDINVGDTITMELSSITKEYYYFLDGLQNIMYPVDPMGFSGSPARVDGNVNDGSAYGYFYCAEVIREKVVVQDDLE